MSYLSFSRDPWFPVFDTIKDIEFDELLVLNSLRLVTNGALLYLYHESHSLSFRQTCACVCERYVIHSSTHHWVSIFIQLCFLCAQVCLCVFSDRIHVVAAQQHALQSQQREASIGKTRWGEAGDFVYSIWPPPQCGYVQNLSLWTTHFSTAKLGCVGVCFCKSRPLKQLLNLGLIYCS